MAPHSTWEIAGWFLNGSGKIRLPLWLDGAIYLRGNVCREKNFKQNIPIFFHSIRILQAQASTILIYILNSQQKLWESRP